MPGRPTYEELEKKISELEQAEFERKKAEEELSQIFSMSLDMICIADINTATFIKVNPAFTSILGYTEKELLEKPFLAFVHPDDVDRTQALIDKKLLRGDKVINFENRHRCKDGSYRWLSWVSQPNLPKGVTYAVARDITEGKQYEEELKKSKAMLDATGRMAKVGGWELDADTFEVTWTEETYHLHEIPLEQKPRLKEAINFFHPEDRERLEQAIQRALDHGEPYDMEIRFITAKGNLLWARTKCESIVVDGKVVRLMGTFQDITARKRAEQALQESEGKFRSLVEQAAEMLFFHDLKGNLIDVNLAAVSNTGYSREDLKKMTVFDLDPDALARNDMQRYWQSLEIGAPPFTIEGRHRRKDGSIYLAEIVGSKIVIQGHEYILVLARDVTDRKQAEAALRKSAETHSHILKTAMDGFWLADTDGKLIEVNEAYCQMSGYSAQELLTMSIWDLDANEDAEEVSLHSKKITHEGQDRFEAIHRRKDGTYFDVEVSVQYSSIDGGRHIAFLRDITERKQMEDQLRQAQKMESIGNLAGGIAHDFNNILQPISGMAELIMEDTSPGEYAYRFAEEIYKAAMRGSDIVNRILAFSRKSDNKKKAVLLQSIVVEALKLSRSTIPAEIEIASDIQQQDCIIHANSSQIHQAVMNLITNAFHALEEKGGKIFVSLSETVLSPDKANVLSLEAGRYALLSITDTGCGIDPVIIDNIFEPYFTTKDPGKGTGLGLALVYGIIKEHDGDIRVVSEINRGTAIKILLPLLEEKVDSPPQSTAQLSHEKGTERVLLVDDELSIISLNTVFLGNLGYQVTASSNSLEALEAFKVEPEKFDLVITDMSMPGITGLQLAEEISSIRPDIPIVLCTGFSERITNNKAMAMGIQRILEKPVKLAKMAKTVRELLDSKK